MIEGRLRKALQESGCPVCRLVREASDIFYKWFVIETYGEPPLLERLSHGGFCQYHAWEVARIAGERVSFTYEFLVSSAEVKLRELLSVALACSREAKEGGQTNSSSDSRGWRRGLGRFIKGRMRCRYVRAVHNFERKEPCPLCQTLQDAETFASKLLVEMLQEPVGRALFTQSEGLCLEHFAMVLTYASPETAAFLAQDYLQRMADLREGFREYFRKKDYRFAAEPKGEEQVTWLKAVERFAGSGRIPYWISKDMLEQNLRRVRK
ncbi:MAG: hypothetical protein HPY71_09475 [Firmicutes bacterium]|nr:hypothetical protein [Bacillota bacterium]